MVFAVEATVNIRAAVGAFFSAGNLSLKFHLRSAGVTHHGAILVKKIWSPESGVREELFSGGFNIACV
jgi:hypothetical protein